MCVNLFLHFVILRFSMFCKKKMSDDYERAWSMNETYEQDFTVCVLFSQLYFLQRVTV